MTLQGFGAERGKPGGEPNAETGWLSNPYRTVIVGGSPRPDAVPFQRIRHIFSTAAHLTLPTGGRVVPYIGFRPSYRFYFDDWGLRSHTPELRVFLPVSILEFRLTGRYYWQNAASFWSEVDGKPNYATEGLPCTTCTLAQSRNGKFASADPKLSSFSAAFVEVRVALQLSFFAKIPKFPMSRWLSEGILQLSYGHYFNGGYAHTAFGDAEVGGLELSFPL